MSVLALHAKGFLSRCLVLAIFQDFVMWNILENLYFWDDEANQQILFKLPEAANV